MDRQKNSRTITVKINGNERQVEENVQKLEEPLIHEIVERENLLLSEAEIASAQETVEESFDWILPNQEEDLVEFKVADHSKKKKNSSDSSSLKKHLSKQQSGGWKSMIISVLLAIAIGTSFGFLVLKLVITEPKNPASPVVTEPVAITPTKINEAVLPTSQTLLQPFDTFVVQGGVFSSVEAAKTIEEDVQKKGIPTQIIESDGKVYLFLGSADSIDRAKALGAWMKDNGIDVFAKPYTIQEKNVADLSKVESEFLAEAPKIYGIVAQLSVDGLLMNMVDSTAVTNLQNRLKAFSQTEMNSMAIIQMRGELEGAVEALVAFEVNPKKSKIIEAQRHLLAYFGLYDSL